MDDGGDGPSGSKRACVERDGNMRARAMLAMSNFCQEQWVEEMLRVHMTRGDSMKIALLSGDAGCGKSYAISLLANTLKSLGISVLVSAMTNKAAGMLMDSCSLEAVYTFHKLMGFKRTLLDDKLSTEEFIAEYRKLYRCVSLLFSDMYQKDLSSQCKPLSERHSCATLRPESCAACSKMFRRLRKPKSPGQPGVMEGAPLFLGVNVIIVDEYGLMNIDLLEKMLACLALFYGPNRGPLIVFSGSVSQLQPVGSKPRIWETERFEQLLACSTPLFVNRRQFEDPGYAEAVTYLQFNTVTQESQRIFRSQVVVGEHEIADPDFQPDKIRIFHQDRQQTAYTASYMDRVTKKARAGDKFISVTRTNYSTEGPRGWYDVLKQAAQTLPKLFSVPPFSRNNREKDYLNIEKLWVGCRVRLIWHMDVNGIQTCNPKSKGALLTTQSLMEARTPLRQVQVTDTEGVVEGIRYRGDRGYNEFAVRGTQTGTLYRVTPSQWNYLNWTVSTHPLACLVAMNTYDCQGSTVHGEVLYHPPKHFLRSPIKPSVYVVLTRVLKRDKLQMSNCGFADSVGTVPFYDERLVTYRKRVEMNYSS